MDSKSLIEIGKRLINKNYDEAIYAFSDLGEHFLWMGRLEEYNKQSSEDLNKDYFFVTILLKHLIDDIYKQISSICNRHRYMWKDFAENLGHFILDFFERGIFSLNRISNAVENYYSIMQKINKEQLEKIQAI